LKLTGNGSDNLVNSLKINNFDGIYKYSVYSTLYAVKKYID